MNKHQHMSFGSGGAQPKRSIPVPRIVKQQPAASAQHPPKVIPSSHPLKPAHVTKAIQVQKHVPWLTTAKIPRNSIPRIP
jgi:hypothetical protein